MAYRNLAQGLRTPCVAFDGDRLVAEGAAGEVALAVRRLLQSEPEAQVLIFDDATSLPIEIDFEGTEADVLDWVSMWERKPPVAKPQAVGREAELLPRHWEWLDEQPGGASATLRRLVDEARKSGWDAVRRAQEAAYRFALAMAGDREGFEEATRTLFAGDAAGFERWSEGWPPDVRARARALASRAFVEKARPPRPTSGA